MARNDDVAVVGVSLGAAVIFFGCVAAWVTHIWWIFTMLMANAPLQAGRVLLAFLGVFIPPIGALHGVYLWFNAW